MQEMHAAFLEQGKDIPILTPFADALRVLLGALFLSM